MNNRIRELTCIHKWPNGIIRINSFIMSMKDDVLYWIPLTQAEKDETEQEWRGKGYDFAGWVEPPDYIKQGDRKDFDLE